MRGAAKKAERRKTRKGTATRTASATANSKGAGGARQTETGHQSAETTAAPAPADTSGRTHFEPEPPPSLIPPDVQDEIDRLIRVNRQLRAALRSLLEDE